MFPDDWADTARWPRRQSLVIFIFRSLTLIPAALGKRLACLVIIRTLVFIMGRIIRARNETKKNSTALEKQDTTVEIESICPICQEPVGLRNAEGTMEGWSVLPCGHRFGGYCIKHYFGIAAEERALCPVCRQAAHHRCGHPVLPTVLSSPDRKHTVLSTETSVAKRDSGAQQLLLSMPCDYCRDPNTAENQPDRHSSSRWNIPLRPFRWLLGLTPFGRNSRSQSRERSDGRSRLDRIGRRGGRTGGAPVPDEGPWMDTFPRYRDPGWERWWNDQAPSTRA